MFAHSASLNILTLVTGALFLQTVSAASPCPDITSYTLIYNPADPTGCTCMNNANNNEPAIESPNTACTYTLPDCTATCPTGSRRRRRSEPKINTNPDLSIRNCSQDQTSCPITSSVGSNHECVNTQTDLDNCGGCAALGQGQICGKQAGVLTASCISGTCQTYSCRSGYTLDTTTGKCTRAD
ncbi:hypothetical protein JOM56_008170 [Amanita muscaria]